MDKYEILDYIIQSRVSMKSMPDDLLVRGCISFINEFESRDLYKYFKKEGKH